MLLTDTVSVRREKVILILQWIDSLRKVVKFRQKFNVAYYYYYAHDSALDEYIILWFEKYSNEWKPDFILLGWPGILFEIPTQDISLMFIF